MRVDNGEPLGSTHSGITSALSLWLIAHDVDMIFNKPRCPQANAKVERMQGTSARWAEIHKAQNLKDLQTRLDIESVFQREKFPVSRLNYQTRLQAFEELETSRRIFNDNAFDEKRVYQFLSKKIYARIVSKNGQIYQFGQRVFVGKQFQYQTIGIKFDVHTCQWNVYNHSNVIKSFEAQNLRKDRIQNLTVFMPMNET
jgi:hypothetical protein